MKKIITRSEQDKKRKKNQFIIGIILIALMLFSTLGYALSGNSEDNTNSKKIEYKGIEFLQDNSGYWHFNVQGYDFVTKYNPEEVKDVSFFNYLTLQNYANKPLYFVGDYQEPIYEISRNINPFVARFNNACLDEENCKGNFPVKNCSEDNIIIIQEIDYDSESEVKENILQQDNCIFITANLGNQTKYADALLFKLLRAE